MEDVLYMKNVFKSNRLIVPIYINEKLVLDMLAIMEDGFSMVSQVNYTENSENNNSETIELLERCVDFELQTFERYEDFVEDISDEKIKQVLLIL